MEFQKKMKEIKSGKLSPIYIVQGKEDYLQNWARQVFLESVVAPEDQELNVGRFNMEETSVQTAVEDAESVEFILNENGTYSILIKNIEDIQSK